MKLRAYQSAMAWASAVVLAAAGITLAVSWREMAIALERNQFAGELVSGKSQLRFLLVEYLLQGGERPRSQWLMRHDSLTALLASRTFDGSRHEATMDRMRERHAQVRTAFLRLMEGRAMARASPGVLAGLREEDIWLANEMMEVSQEILDDGSRLVQASDADLARTLWLGALVAALSLAFMGLVIAENMFSLRRRVLEPLRELQAGMAIVGGGDLSYRMRASRIDEIGELTGAFNEMTALQQRSHAELERRAEQLAAASRELEAFSYSASHDLRAPLQTIDGFSRALEEDYGDKLAGEGKDYLMRIRAASQRMAQLIDDMLRLSRVTRAELALEPVDLGALVGEVADELRARFPGREVALKIAPQAVAFGDRRLLRIALDNLVGNAWKFTAAHARAHVEFGTFEHGGERAFFVRDDGVGFESAQAGKLFVPFQRLHSTSAYPGTGIGLATVRRIVRRHGGQAWAEGAVDKGATFYFTLSANPAAAAADIAATA